MSREIEFCASGSDLQVALSLMRETRVRRLPIVDADGKLVGVLSLKRPRADGPTASAATAIRELACEVAQTLAAIGEPRFRSPRPDEGLAEPPRRVAGAASGRRHALAGPRARSRGRSG
jgi:CBS-domain-containing membrane protein